MQLTFWKNTLSNIPYIGYRVPHGSMLDPLLFILFTLTIWFAVLITPKRCVCGRHFLRCAKNYQDVDEKSRIVLKMVEKWFSAKKVKLNLEKMQNLILIKFLQLEITQ